MNANKFFVLGVYSTIFALTSCGNKEEKGTEKSEEKAKVSLCECAGMDYAITTEAGLLKKYGGDVIKDCDKYFANPEFLDKARACPELEDFFKDMDEFDKMMEGIDPVLPPSVPSDVDCDKFLTDYELFLKDYISLAKKLKSNPQDVSVLTRYSELSIKASNFMSEAIACSMNPEYADRLEKLNKEMEGAAAGL